MVATELALAVIHRPEILVAVVLFSERLMAKLEPQIIEKKAPLAATKNMYLDTEGNVIEGKVPPHQ
jgi:gamma-glutamyltranspeptidase/glutathione hydrolase